MHRLLLALTLSFCFSAAAVAADDAQKNPALFGAVDPQPAAAAARKERAASAAPAAKVEPARTFDYSVNLSSNVFGAKLFTGAFAREGATQFNPDYAVAIGDQVQLRLWGAYEFDSALTVDPRGSLFIPHIGPVTVVGVRNQDLQRVVESAVRRVYRANVYSYVSLAAAQPVRIFVGGFVYRPGLYNGTSMDSLLHYLDQAGGIDPERGSFLEVQVKRGGQVRATVNLYDFLLDGRIPVIQLADGDVVFVAPRKNTVQVSGFAGNPNQFEFAAASLTVAELAKLARPSPRATHVRIVRHTGSVRNTEYFPIDEAARIAVSNGDELNFTADKKPGTITVRVEGEHQSAQEYVLPYGARMGELMRRIEFSDRSDAQSVQLYRQSVRERQKALLQTSMKTLESTVLTARSGTSDEARLRKEEADLILQWVERAKQIEPSGQVMIAQASGRDNLLLENGDLIKVPSRDGLVLVSGEVLFPNAIAYEPEMDLEAYIQRAGGYTQNADNSRVVVAHRNGSFEPGTGKPQIRAGDEVLVLPKVDVKSRQIWKDMTQIIYQIAISAKVILGL